jgi:hypothetical protein
LIFTFLAIPFTGISQRKAYKVQKNNKNRFEAYPNPYDFRPNGWLFDAGLIGTTGLRGEQKNTFGDTVLTTSTNLRPGITLNVGRYQSLKKGHKLVKYIDYNLGYKMLWNTEQQTQEITQTGVSNSFTNNNHAHYIDVNLNFNNVVSFTDYLFLQNSIGLNLDYRFFSTASGQGINANLEPDPMVIQLHYKLALGYMFKNNMAIIPYIEIPLFNITPQQKEFSQLDYFNSSYQSFTIGARLMLFRLGQKDCPTAITTDGKSKKNGY